MATLIAIGLVSFLGVLYAVAWLVAALWILPRQLSADSVDPMMQVNGDVPHHIDRDSHRALVEAGYAPLNEYVRGR